MVAALLWLALGTFSSTLKVDSRGLSIGDVKQAQFDDYVSVDGNVVPIQVVQISPEEGGVVMERVAEEGSHVRKGDVIVRLNNSNLDLEILNAESELAEKQNMLRNTQITMEQDRLNNQNEAAQLSMDVQAKKRTYNHQTALQQEQLNSREEYLKAKEDYVPSQCSADCTPPPRISPSRLWPCHRLSFAGPSYSWHEPVELAERHSRYGHRQTMAPLPQCCNNC